MFNNLIESTSHAKEFKRRGSFLLVTTATYFVLFAVAGVASIYAYDAHLAEGSTELELLGMIPIEPPSEAPRERPRDAPRPASTPDRPVTESIRTQLISSTADPTLVPDKPGTTAVNIPPALPYSKLGSVNADPEVPPSSGPGVSGGTGTGTGPVVNIPDQPPAPLPTPSPVKILRISVVLNSQALELPKPIYPPIARQIRQQGTVTVQVMIDESGNVISAKATSGPPLLTREAEKAAFRARFSPTRISDQAVKVSGVITYNFVLN